MRDFKKVFGLVEHGGTLEALKAQGVNPRNISLLQQFYEGQAATARTDVSRVAVDLLRGAKQGDPFSSHSLTPYWNTSLHR